MQEPCTAIVVTSTEQGLQSAACSLPSVVSPLPPPAPRSVILAAGATPAEEATAREKARFCADVTAFAAANHLPLKDAAPIAAAVAGAYPHLAPQDGGKNLLAGAKAYLNFRSWSTRLSGEPEAWRNLLPRYRGARAYTAPGDPRFWPLVSRIYEHPNQPSLKRAYKLARLACGPAGITDIPNYDQLRHYYANHVDQKAVMIARQGADWFRNHVAGYIEREAPGRDEAWVGDHHVFDLGCKVWDADKCAWRAERPWLTAWLDWGTLSFVGWQIRCLDPNRDSIERSLRGAIRRNNNHAPVVLYIDNGADYKAKGFTRPAGKGDEERASSIAAALGCKVIFAIPYNARAKIIERMFREVALGFSKMFGGYRGSNPTKRPGEADYYWTHPEELPTLDEVAVAFEKWLTLCFHAEPSQGNTLAGKSPAEARAAAAPA